MLSVCCTLFFLRFMNNNDDNEEEKEKEEEEGKAEDDDVGLPVTLQRVEAHKVPAMSYNSCRLSDSHQFSPHAGLDSHVRLVSKK